MAIHIKTRIFDIMFCAFYLPPSSSGSVNGWINVDTDVCHFSVAMPMLTWVFLVFQVWLPQMFAQHPQQSEDTIQHEGHALRKFAERQTLHGLVEPFFLKHTTFHGVTGNTRVDCILCPCAVVPHITSCKVWRRAGDTLQVIQTNQPQAIFARTFCVS